MAILVFGLLYAAIVLLVFALNRKDAGMSDLREELDHKNASLDEARQILDQQVADIEQILNRTAETVVLHPEEVVVVGGKRLHGVQVRLIKMPEDMEAYDRVVERHARDLLQTLAQRLARLESIFSGS